MSTSKNISKIESEKTIEKILNLSVKKLGGWSIKLLPFNIAGLPDRICLFPRGRLFFAEIKTTKKEPTPIQKIIHKKLRSLGFEVHIIDKSEQIKEILSNYE